MSCCTWQGERAAGHAALMDGAAPGRRVPSKVGLEACQQMLTMNIGLRALVLRVVIMSQNIHRGPLPRG